MGITINKPKDFFSSIQIRRISIESDASGWVFLLFLFRVALVRLFDLGFA